jgi:AcrR family transcriptional regulator
MKREVLATDGRRIGSRATQTRRRILDATARLLDERGVLDLKVVDITREVSTSPATFYQYFADVSEAILALVDEAAADQAVLFVHLEPSWSGAKGRDQAHALTEAFITYWEEHQAILRVRNLQADEGDVRFREARSRASQSLIEGLSAKLAEGQAAGRVAEHLNPYATSAAMLAVLERLTTYLAEFGKRGVSRGDIVETISCILYQTLTGRKC